MSMNEKEIVARFTADTSGFTAGAEEIEASSKAVEASTANMGGGIEESTQAINHFNEAGAWFTKTADGMVSYSDNFAKQFNGVSSAVDDASGAFNKMGDNIEKVEGGFIITNDAAEKTADKMGGVTKGFEEVGNASAASSQQADAAVREFLGLGDSTQKASGGFNLFSMEGMMAVQVAMQIAAVIGQGIKAMADEQQAINNTAMAFTTLTGDADKAAQAINNLNTSAAAKDFGAASIDNAAKHLMLLGENSDQASKEVQLVADGIAAVGGSANQIDPVVSQLHNLKDQSKATTQEIDQIASSGLPAWQALANGMGTSVAEAQRRVKDGAVTGNQAMTDIMKGLQQYGGAADTQGQNLNAEWTRFGDNLGKVFKPIADLLAQDLEQINELIEGVSKASDFVKGLGQAMSVLGINPLGPIGAFVGHASGIIDSPVGHMAMVGENGPEPMWIPQGASVFPSGTDPFAALSSMAPTLAGVASGGFAASGAPQTVNLQVILDTTTIAQKTIPLIAPQIRILTGSRR